MSASCKCNHAISTDMEVTKSSSSSSSSSSSGNGGGHRYPKIRYPIQGGVKQLFQKVLVLVQIRFDGHQSQLDSVMLENDVTSIFRVGERVARAICKHASTLDGFTVRYEAAMLHKAMEARMWPDSTVPMAQIPTVGVVRARKLAMAGIGTLQAVETHSARAIGEALSRKTPFGENVKAAVRRFPKWSVSMEQQVADGDGVRITVIQTRADLDVGGGTDQLWVHVLVGDQSNRVLFDRRLRVTVAQFVFTAVIQLPEGAQRLRAKVLNASVIGLDAGVTFVVGGGGGGGRGDDEMQQVEVKSVDDDNNDDGDDGVSGVTQSSAGNVIGVCAHSAPKCMQRLCRHQCCKRSGLPSMLVKRKRKEGKPAATKKASVGTSATAAGTAATLPPPRPPTTIDMIQAFRVQSNLPNRVKSLRAAPTVMALPPPPPPLPASSTRRLPKNTSPSMSFPQQQQQHRQQPPPPPQLPPINNNNAITTTSTSTANSRVKFSFSDVYADLFK